MRFYVVVLLQCFAVYLVFHATQPVYGQKNTPARQRIAGFSCLAGRPGIPGLHGNPGAPGQDGRDGRPGSPGKRGPRGFDGTPGRQGSPGPPGSTGAPDPQGLKRNAGPKGERGEPGTRGLSAYFNWKECSWTNINDGKDNGLIRDCVFYKNYTDSFLHVYWNGDFRIRYCNHCCKRWFFSFNGTECKTPRAIDGIVHMTKGTDLNLHRVHHIEGHCDKIHKGQVRVGFNVGNCPGFGS